MRRRALLAALVVLGGCQGLLPAAHPPAGLPESPPRVLCDAAWDGTELTITVEAGHAITADRVRNLSVTGTAEGTTVWASTVVPGRARGSFPVEPGDSITVRVPEDFLSARLTVSTPWTATTLCTFRRGGDRG